MRRIKAATIALAAWAGQAVAQVPPAPEALVERFVAAVPQLSGDGDARAQAEAVRHLRSLNPSAPEADLQAAAAEASACFAPLTRATTYRALRQAARQLGAEKLRRLIAFYEGPDHARLSQIGAVAERGVLSAAQSAERARIMATYPFADFLASAQAAVQAMRTDPTFNRDNARCQAVGAAAVARRGLRGE